MMVGSMNPKPALPQDIAIAGQVALQEYMASGLVDQEIPWGIGAKSIGRVLAPALPCGLTVHVTGEVPDSERASTAQKQYLLLFHDSELFKSLELPCRRVRLRCTERLSRLAPPRSRGSLAGPVVYDISSLDQHTAPLSDCVAAVGRRASILCAAAKSLNEPRKSRVIKGRRTLATFADAIQRDEFRLYRLMQRIAWELTYSALQVSTMVASIGRQCPCLLASASTRAPRTDPASPSSCAGTPSRSAQTWPLWSGARIAQVQAPHPQAKQLPVVQSLVDMLTTRQERMTPVPALPSGGV